MKAGKECCSKQCEFGSLVGNGRPSQVSKARPGVAGSGSFTAGVRAMRKRGESDILSVDVMSAFASNGAYAGILAAPW